jgi:hypothetical protein
MRLLSQYRAQEAPNAFRVLAFVLVLCVGWVAAGQQVPIQQKQSWHFIALHLSEFCGRAALIAVISRPTNVSKRLGETNKIIYALGFATALG